MLDVLPSNVLQQRRTPLVPIRVCKNVSLDFQSPATRLLLLIGFERFSNLLEASQELLKLEGGLPKVDNRPLQFSSFERR